MTVKELKEKLNQFNDNFIVMIPSDNIDKCSKLYFPYVVANNVSQGVNEADCCVFIDDYDDND